VSTSAPSTQGWVLADAFDRAAPTYDAMVALSPGYHDQLLGAAGALLDRLPAPDGSAAGQARRLRPCSSNGAPAGAPPTC
jgi:hypothetical protein